MNNLSLHLYRTLRGTAGASRSSFLKCCCNLDGASAPVIRKFSCNSARLKSSGFQRIAQNTPESKKTTLYYLGAIGVLVVGASYCAVPLYRIFCQVSSDVLKVVKICF